MKIMLNKLLPDEVNLPELFVQGITADSRKIKPGDLFVAIPGLHVDGRQFIGEAERKHAVAVLCEPRAPVSKTSIPVLEIDNLKSKVGAIASRYFGDPSSRLSVVAITGTNGKTSCSHFIAQALSSLGCRCGVVGTIGYGAPGDLIESSMTTPDSIDLQDHLAYLVKKSCKVVALEASSHGLEQGRLNGTKVETAIFTNITRDHLDYHDSFEAYQEAKKLLFTRSGLETVIINMDDDYGEVLKKSVSEGVDIYTTSILNSAADLHCQNITLDENGMSFELISPWGESLVKSRLMGEFNISNLLSTAALLGSRGFSLKDIVTAISNAGAVKGRMEVLRNDNQPTVVIDYAHTPDALEKALRATHNHCKGDLWCVFGCGGDRDRGKRSEMGRIASRLAQHIMITDDNPRSESSMTIVGDIFQGVICGSDVEIETNRRSAIRKVLARAGAGDVVLIAGKGHEEYQEVMGEKLAFSDHEVVREFVSKSR